MAIPKHLCLTRDGFWIDPTSFKYLKGYESNHHRKIIAKYTPSDAIINILCRYNRTSFSLCRYGYDCDDDFYQFLDRKFLHIHNRRDAIRLLKTKMPNILAHYRLNVENGNVEDVFVSKRQM